MMEGFAKQTSPLLLDIEHPIPSIELDKVSLSSFKSVDNEQFETKPKSTFQKIKHKIKKSFKKKHETSDNLNINDDDEQISTSSDASSHTNPGDTFQKKD